MTSRVKGAEGEDNDACAGEEHLNAGTTEPIRNVIKDCPPWIIRVCSWREAIVSTSSKDLVRKQNNTQKGLMYISTSSKGKALLAHLYTCRRTLLLVIHSVKELQTNNNTHDQCR